MYVDLCVPVCVCVWVGGLFVFVFGVCLCVCVCALGLRGGKVKINIEKIKRSIVPLNGTIDSAI